MVSFPRYFTVCITYRLPLVDKSSSSVASLENILSNLQKRNHLIEKFNLLNECRTDSGFECDTTVYSFKINLQHSFFTYMMVVNRVL